MKSFKEQRKTADYLGQAAPRRQPGAPLVEKARVVDLIIEAVELHKTLEGDDSEEVEYTASAALVELLEKVKKL